MIRQILLGVALCVSVGACDSSPTDLMAHRVILSTLRAEYGATDTIKIGLKNSSAMHAYVANCPVLERNTAIGWEPVDGDPPLCPPDVSPPLVTVGPGDETQIIRQPVLAWMIAGDYRYRVFVGPEPGDAAAVTSNRFTIAR